MKKADIRSRLLLENEDMIKELKLLKAIPAHKLQRRPAAHAWNVLECVEHLNRYNAFYLPHLQKEFAAAPNTVSPRYSPGIIGSYFVRSMEPGRKKMKTAASKNPLGSNPDKKAIGNLLLYQEWFGRLLQESEHKNWNRLRIPVSFMPRFLHIKLGDCLRFIGNHNLRHMRQINDILEKA